MSKDADADEWFKKLGNYSNAHSSVDPMILLGSEPEARKAVLRDAERARDKAAETARASDAAAESSSRWRRRTRRWRRGMKNPLEAIPEGPPLPPTAPQPSKTPFPQRCAFGICKGKGGRSRRNKKARRKGITRRNKKLHRKGITRRNRIISK